MDKPVCNDDNCTIEETECCGGTRGNWPHKEPDGGKKPTGHKKPRPIEETECGGTRDTNWPDPDRNPDDRPVDETECGGGEVRNWPKYPDDEEGWKKPCGGKKPTPGGPRVAGGGISCEVNWPLPDKDPDDDDTEIDWRIKPYPHLGPVGGPHIPIEDPILDGKDPHEGIGPYRVIGPIINGKEPDDGLNTGPRPA